MGSVLSYIASIISGDINAVKNWILSAINAVYSTLNRYIQDARNDITTAYNDAVDFARTVQQYAEDVYNWAKSSLDTLGHDIIQYTDDLYNDLKTGLNDLTTWVTQGLDDLHNWVDDLINDVENWVINDIWDPIYNFVAAAVNWVDNEGATIWNLITHPELLMKLLASYVWGTYIDLIKTYADPIAKWLLKTMLSEASTLGDAIEEIISHMM